jgi:hypothetical protein
MRTLAIIGLSLFLARPSLAQCSVALPTHGRLQWSQRAKVVAPDRSWVVEVHPVLSAAENQTPVTLHQCAGPKSWPLFTLQRSAELYWGSDSKHVLVVNEPLAGTRKLLLFTLQGLSGTQETSADALDKKVNEKLIERLGNNRHIQFYLPGVVSWKGNNLLLAVGGETFVENVGPLDSYCYGLRIDTETLRVEGVLSEKELKATTGHSCRVSP